MSVALFSSDVMSDRDRWERDRLAALQRFDVLDSPREEAFDRITRLIRNIFGVRIGIVSMMDAHRQWYKAVDGLTTHEASRGETFCRFPLESGEPVVVPDATRDPRFSDNPHVTGDPHIRFYAGVPLLTHDGHAIGTLCAVDYEARQFTRRETEILEDLARIAMNELELRQRATIDVLTGALSRGAFKDEGARAMALAARHGHELSCIAFDLDHFKRINDTYGHAAGDKVLVRVIKACVSCLRQSDLIGRLGGEEFAILLPYADARAAVEIAEKLRMAIGSLTFDFKGQPVSVTASFGVSSAAGSPKDIEAILETADEALYKAKLAGRNCCASFSDRKEEPRAPRRRVLKAGRIVFNGNASTIDCTVRSLAEDGAELQVSSTAGIPPKFTLHIPADTFRSECRITSQTDRQIEVAF